MVKKGVCQFKKDTILFDVGTKVSGYTKQIQK